MTERKNYEMSAEDLETLLDASKPTRVMFLSGGQSMYDTPQENANRAWGVLGRKMGFDPMTAVRTGKGDRFFSAIPMEEAL